MLTWRAADAGGITNGVFNVQESKTLQTRYQGNVLIEGDAINYLDSLEGADEVVVGTKGKTSLLNVIQRRPGAVQFRKEVALHEDGRMELTVRMRLFPYTNTPDKQSITYSFRVPAKLLDGTHFKAFTGRGNKPEIVEGDFSATRSNGNLVNKGCHFIAFKGDKLRLVIDCNPGGLITRGNYCRYGEPVGVWGVSKQGDAVVFSFGSAATAYGGIFSGKAMFYTGEYDFAAKHFYQNWSYTGATPALAQFTFGTRAETKGFEKADAIVYGAGTKWGWEDSSGLELLQTPSPDVIENCLWATDGKPRTFQLDVTPGYYMVTVRAGHNTKDIGPFSIRLNGKLCVQDTRIQAGKTQTLFLSGKTGSPDGQLRITFGGAGPWAVRSIVVQPIVYHNEDFTFDRSMWMADGLFSPEIE